MLYRLRHLHICIRRFVFAPARENDYFLPSENGLSVYREALLFILLLFV